MDSLFKFYTSSDTGNVLDIGFKTGNDNFIILAIQFLGKYYQWNVGLLGVNKLFLLTYQGGSFILFLDGHVINQKEEKTNGPDAQDNNNPNNDTTSPKKEESASDKQNTDKPNESKTDSATDTSSSTNSSTSTKSSTSSDTGSDTGTNNNLVLGDAFPSIENFQTHGEDGTFFINKPFLINPNKQINCNLYTLFAFKHALNRDQLSQLYEYFICDRCLLKQTSKTSEKETTHVRENDIINLKEHVNSEMEQESREKQIKCEVLLKQDEKKKQKQRADIKCKQKNNNGETEKLLKSLIKAFNKKEEDNNNNPCQKIKYIIKDDGKVVRQIYKIPNCDPSCVDNNICSNNDC